MFEAKKEVRTADIEGQAQAQQRAISDIPGQAQSTDAGSAGAFPDKAEGLLHIRSLAFCAQDLKRLTDRAVTNLNLTLLPGRLNPSLTFCDA